MAPKEQIVAIIDYIIEHKETNQTDLTLSPECLVSTDEFEPSLQILKANKGFQSYSIGRSSGPDNESFIDGIEVFGINSLALFEYKQKILELTQSPTIKLMAVRQIAIIMGGQYGATALIKLLLEAGVPNYLIVYPNTKWRMIDDIFRVLVTSKDKDLNQLFFKVLEDFCHPLCFGGDKERAFEIQDQFSNLLEYDGYCFNKNRIVAVTDEILKEIENRKQERSLKLAQAFSGPSPFESFFKHQSNPTSSHPQKSVPINITIHNNNRNIQNISSNRSDVPTQDLSKVTKPSKEKNKFYFTEDENIEFNGVIFYDLTDLQRRLCKTLFTQDVNFCFKTIDVEEEVYGGEATKDRQDKLKKTVERTNSVMNIEFGIEFIRYSSATIRRLI